MTTIGERVAKLREVYETAEGALQDLQDALEAAESDLEDEEGEPDLDGDVASALTLLEGAVLDLREVVSPVETQREKGLRREARALLHSVESGESKGAGGTWAGGVLTHVSVPVATLRALLAP